MTPDYKRNGTVDLFAAMNVTTGEVQTETRHQRSPPEGSVFIDQLTYLRPILLLAGWRTAFRGHPVAFDNLRPLRFVMRGAYKGGADLVLATRSDDKGGRGRP